MNRLYSPESYCTYGPCASQLSTQRIKSTMNLHSALSLNQYGKQQRKKIGNYYYSDKDEIGKGFSSIVYKAYKKQNGFENKSSEQYAIKVIPLNKSSLSSLELLQNQIDIIKTLNHPNIIKCYDIYKSKTHCYIITEYCDGGCLMKYLSKHQANGRKNIDQHKIIDIVQQIIQGIKYLHLKGVVHRDLKPANILKGKNGWKIADFGFAIFANSEVKSKFNVGTPLYMPLQSLTDNIYSPESDIFSLGIIFYELLSGITPWESKNQKQLIRKLQLIPLKYTQAKHKIDKRIFELLVRLCSNKRKTRMSKQQFSLLIINQFLCSQRIQNPEIQIQDKKTLYSIKSQANLQRKLRQNKSMDNLQVFKQKNSIQLNNYEFKGSLIVQQKLPVQQPSELEKIRILHKNKSNQRTKKCQIPQIKSFCSKKQIFSTIKDRYFDIQISGNTSNLLKKTVSIHPSSIQTYKSMTLQQRQVNPKQDNTISTAAKQSQVSKNQQVNQREINYKIQQQITHALFNQIHFSRFLFYLYKNISFILTSKFNQQKLSILIFKLIKLILNQISELQSQLAKKNSDKIKKYSDVSTLKSYIRTERYSLVKKTILQYKMKYEKQQIDLQSRIGQKSLQQIKQHQKLSSVQLSKIFPQNSQMVLLKYIQKQIKILLHEFNHNLILKAGYFSNTKISVRQKKQDWLFLSNIEGLKNLYQFYSLLKLFIKYQNDYKGFETKSKIKVNTDYSKNKSSYQDFQNLKQLIKFL